MSEIGIKEQCFGVEVEMTGITREEAAQALAEYFGTTPEHHGGGYDTWKVWDSVGKEWKLMSDGSINPERKRMGSYEPLEKYSDAGNLFLPHPLTTRQTVCCTCRSTLLTR